MFWDRRAMIEWSFALRFEPSKLVVVTVWRMLPTLLDFSHTLPEELLLLFRDSTADDTGSLEGVTPRTWTSRCCHVPAVRETGLAF
jgi:hypothetical protein